MGENSGIEWTEDTWNPIRGCKPVKGRRGCANCYAMRLAGTRLKAVPGYAGLTSPTKLGPVWNGKWNIAPSDILYRPIRQKRGRLIFVDAMSDLFYEEIPLDTIALIWAIMIVTPRHTYQVLTKRHARAMQLLTSPVFSTAVAKHVVELRKEFPKQISGDDVERNVRGVLPGLLFSKAENIWMGHSVEDQRALHQNRDAILDTPSHVRWLSVEPMVDSVVLDDVTWPHIDWIVCGGESGGKDPAISPQHVRYLHGAALRNRVPFLFKQWGDWLPYEARSQALFVPSSALPGRSAGGVHRDVIASSPKSLWRTLPGDPDIAWRKAGKGAAGRMLDGFLWNEYPRAMRVPS